MRVLFGSVGGTLLGLVLVGAVIGGVALGRIWYINTFGVATENARTNVIRQTNQYVTTQQTAMQTLLDDYARATDDGQRAYLVAQVHHIASTLSSDNVPQEVAVFLATHPRGSR